MTIDLDRKNYILTEANRLFPQQVELRRALHRYPELSFKEHETTKRLRKLVEELGLRVLPLDMETGVLAELRGGREGPTVAVRSDIDALPVREQTGLPFASEIDGCMHACGHDVHMATVYGVAALLQSMRDDLAGNVRFLFQPAEEHPPGGARPMIENGALENVAAIFGLHVEPHLPVGKISLRDGPTMASVTDFDLVVRGVAGHAARPHLCVDAVVTAAEIIESVQKIVSRELDPVDPVVITFGQIHGGVARNVIAGEVILHGTARTLSRKAARSVPSAIKRIATGIAKARGAGVELTMIANYPVLSNHVHANRVLARNFEQLYGRGKIEETDRGLGGEDFACYLEKVRGAMFRLGIMNKKIKADKPWHSPEFIVDENAIPVGTSLLAAAVIDTLQGGLK